MAGLTKAGTSKLQHCGAGLALAAIVGLFAYRHVHAFAETGEWPYLVFCLSETLQAALFIVRYQPVSVSTDPLDWTVAVAGSVLPLLLVPAETSPQLGAVIVTAMVLQILGLVSINRSFAVVAAKRKIRTNGMYRIVRHPIYASYLVLFSGYVWANATAWNVSLFCAIVACIVGRVLSEERHLCGDRIYREYTAQVRYRLVPFLF